MGKLILSSYKIKVQFQVRRDKDLCRCTLDWIERFHQFVEDQKAYINPLRKRNDVETNRIFKFGASDRILASNLGHDGVSNDVASAHDHTKIGRVENFGERV